MKTISIRVKMKGHWMEYNNHYFIENMDDYKIHAEQLNNRVAISESEIKNLDSFMGHGHSSLTGVVGIACGMISDKEKRQPMLVNLKILHARVLSDQLLSLANGEKLVINKSGGYFSIKPSQEYEIINKNNSNNEYTKKDIKTNKWWGGSHYYAKVGTIDVVDKNGDVKWNTEKRAREVAINYMKELNLKQ